MANFIIDVTNGSDKGTINPDAGFRYNINLNQVNEAEIKISGTGANRRGLLTIGATVEIYRDGTLEFKGLIDNTDYFVGGTVVFHASGWEVWLAKENGSYAGSPWTSTASATIFSAIIGESSYFTAGTINAGFSTDFRLTQSQTLYNSLSNLANKTQQDIGVDYINDEIDILDHIGSSSSVATLNEGKEITNLRRSVGYPRGNNILVYGKGDGDNQVEGSASDATSISTYGTVTKTVIDRSIITDAEADKLAAAVLAKEKDPPNIYDFELTNPDYGPVTLGDHITLNALDQDVVNEEVRIVGIERGETGPSQYCSLQVTNPSLKTLMRRQNKIIAKLKKDQIDDNSYMQGNTVTNEWGSGINADSTHAAKVGFYVPPEFETETGNLEVLWMNVDYDIDPYNNQFGDASFTGSDPQVQNDSGDKDAAVSGNSDTTQAFVAGTSDSFQPGVSGTSGSTTPNSAAGVSVWASYTNDYSIRYNKSLCHVEENVLGDSEYYTTRVVGLYMNATGGTVTVDRSMEDANGSSYSSNYSLGNGSVIYYSQGSSSSGNTSGYAKFWDDNYNCSLAAGTQENIYEHSHSSHTHGDGSYYANSHTHADGSYYAVSHSHADGSYLAASHNHPDGSYDINAADLNYISIGDSVSEAGSVNATGATITLEYWNGSSWVTKYTRVFGSDTLKTNVDMTNSGTFPDVDGYWRILITPNSANADFVNAKVRLKFKIDN